MKEEWGTPISKDKIIYRRNKLVELAKVEAKSYTIWHETINENLLDINYMIYEIERLHSIIKEAIEYINEMTLTSDGYANYGDDLRPEHIIDILKGSDK